MHRNPKTIAAELRQKIDGANKFGMPLPLREGLNLAAEFMEATAAAMIAVGVIKDPDEQNDEPGA